MIMAGILCPGVRSNRELQEHGRQVGIASVQSSLIADCPVFVAGLLTMCSELEQELICFCRSQSGVQSDWAPCCHFVSWPALVNLQMSSSCY